MVEIEKYHMEEYQPQPNIATKVSKHFNCEICNSSDTSLFHAHEMMLGGTERFEYLFCNECESTYQPVKLDSYAKYYSTNYYSFQFKEPTNLNGLIRKWKRNARNRFYYFSKGFLGRLLAIIKPRPINHLSHHVKLHLGMSILEVGCGAGELLYELGEIGLTNCIGIDPYVPADIQFKNGVHVYKLTLEEFKKNNSTVKYDLVMFNHSLEHSPTPIKDLELASSFLKSDGELLIRWPVSGSTNAKVYGVNWWSLDSPRHIYLFSVKSMALLANSVSMVISRIHFEGTIDDFLASEQHKSGTPLIASNSYITTGRLDKFTSIEMKDFENQIKDQNKNGTASQAGYVLRFA